jgi:hypothetical protein
MVCAKLAVVRHADINPGKSIEITTMNLSNKHFFADICKYDRRGREIRDGFLEKNKI